MTKRYELDKHKSEIISLYLNKKLTCENIAKDLGYSLCGIYDALRRWNVKTRNLNDSHKIYSHDESYFNIIDSEEKAYWLGFIYTDGYITGDKLGIALSNVDINHLIKFKKCIKAANPINTYLSKSTGKYRAVEYCRILLKSNKLVNDIRDKGVFNENSTYEFRNRLFKRWNNENNTYYLSYGGINKTLNIMDYLYDKAEIYLDRKYEKFITLKAMKSTKL